MENAENIQNQTDSSEESFSLSTLSGLRLVQKTAFIWFFILGVLYIVLEILRSNEISPAKILLFQKSLDLPFALAAITYALTSIRLAFPKVESRSFGFILVSVGVVFMTVLIYFNFFWKDFS